ncbi:hypothetical protein C8F01DRAFT_1033432 [Mycena amicta]|nr:hypothetical protein C8F01DRAFT_1033432 [Mycena amicta]
MADTSLPDEIISEILSPALKVPDEAFADNSDHRSPFANYTESTSAFLVVCKSWLRVATPLLYHVVVLRSKSQATALSKALRKNPELGRFIKKLRLEGGFGSPMNDILSLAPNITDLYLSLDIFSSDTTEGLCKGLPLINPSRLILYTHSYKERSNKHLRNLLNALLEAISAWDHLVSFGAPNNEFSPDVHKIALAINNSKLVQTLTIGSGSAACRLYAWLSDCPLREVRITEALSRLDMEELDENPRLKAIAVYTTRLQEKKKEAETPSYPEIAPSLNPFFTPMADKPQETQDTIWSRISYFAMSIPEHENNPTQKKLPSKLPFLLVSKQFHRVGLPQFYTDVVLTHRRHPVELANVLASYPFLGSHITTIHSNTFSRQFEIYSPSPSPEFLSDYDLVSSDSDDSDTPLPWDVPTSLRRVFSQATQLEKLDLLGEGRADRYTEIPIPWDAFTVLAESAGHSLREIGVNIATGKGATSVLDVFSRFTQLETLRWKSSIVCDCTDIEENTTALPQLQHLEVRLADSTFFDTLSAFKPPSLRRLTLWDDVKTEAEGFLSDRGYLLTVLDIPIRLVKTLDRSILDLCPNLVSLDISWSLYFGDPTTNQPPNKDALLPTTPATSLEKITFRVDFAFQVSRKETPAWAQYLTDLPLDSMPILTQILLPGMEWPTTQRDITKSPWVRAAEELLKSNVSMVDSTGKKWRPRLKVRGR